MSRPWLLLQPQGCATDADYRGSRACWVIVALVFLGGLYGPLAVTLGLVAILAAPLGLAGALCGIGAFAAALGRQHAVESREQQRQDRLLAHVKDCPRCAEQVKRAAAVCRFCGCDLRPEAGLPRLRADPRARPR